MLKQVHRSEWAGPVWGLTSQSSQVVFLLLGSQGALGPWGEVTVSIKVTPGRGRTPPPSPTRPHPRHQGTDPPSFMQGKHNPHALPSHGEDIPWDQRPLEFLTSGSAGVWSPSLPSRLELSFQPNSHRLFSNQKCHETISPDLIEEWKS